MFIIQKIQKNTEYTADFVEGEASFVALTDAEGNKALNIEFHNTMQRIIASTTRSTLCHFSFGPLRTVTAFRMSHRDPSEDTRS